MTLNTHNQRSAIACPACRNRDSEVIDSRGDSQSTFIRRRRMCCACAYRWSTYETTMKPNQVVEQLNAIRQSVNELSRVLNNWLPIEVKRKGEKLKGLP